MSDAPIQTRPSGRPLLWEILARDRHARAGRLTTRRGTVLTPAFMPVGTQGAVKGLMPDEVRQLGAEIVLANTYHLHVRPGEQVIRDLGGLHRFCGWDGPILTDSGGYQVFSLAQRCRVDDDGVTFSDHVEGTRRRLTPEQSIRIQEMLGSDIMMPLDDCTGKPTDRRAADDAMRRTLSWLPRNVAARTDASAALLGIVQGGVFADLRQESLERTVVHELDGYALGGVSVGESREQMRRVIEQWGPSFPAECPRYVMGIGRPQDLVEAVASGFDMFDCVLPTRHGRTAQLFTPGGTINIRNARYRDDPEPLDADCGCPVCRRLSRGYLRHLYTSGEMLGARAGTVHNLWYYLELMRKMRRAIVEQRFERFRTAFYEGLAEDESARGEQP
ncbi:MAG: tRNA guanosine(34) transglycosylase Tgt [Acidobacteriota bacterium]|nr:MAG: tRNA guanosine(34) transglycosylase Tgt [Acidobacteriota bacterium]